MLTLKDLENRVYDGRECVSFQFGIEDKRDELLLATFKRKSETKWTMQVVFQRTNNKDGELYSFTYDVPKRDIKLELVCAVGLRLLQMHLKEEIQQKSILDFALGEVTEGM